jgi:hypothetical protein
MSRVTHATIEPATYQYIGAAIQGWTQNSSLLILVKTIHMEFNKQPPMPEAQNATSVPGKPATQVQYAQKPQRYQGECVNIQKPLLQ